MTHGETLRLIVAILDEQQIVLDLLLGNLEEREFANCHRGRLRLANAQNMLSELSGVSHESDG